MSQKVQKIFLIILFVILSLLTIPKLISYGFEFVEFFKVKMLGWSGNYRVIDASEKALQVIPALVCLITTIIILFMKKIPLIIKNIILTIFIIILIICTRIWGISYMQQPWLYNNRISHNGLEKYTYWGAN